MPHNIWLPYIRVQTQFSSAAGWAVNARAQSLLNVAALASAACSHHDLSPLAKICCKRILSAIFPVHAGLRQTNRIRALYLQRALQQEVGFFDVHATTGMMMQGLNEDTLIIQQAIGEKVGVTIHFVATFIVGYAIGEAAP